MFLHGSNKKKVHCLARARVGMGEGVNQIPSHFNLGRGVVSKPPAKFKFLEIYIIKLSKNVPQTPRWQLK